MKHLLNNISKEEKENILKQHSGGMKVMTENFRRLMGAKHGNVKPLVEQGNTQLSLSQGLKSTINGASKDLNGVKKICDFCKRSNVKQQSNTSQLITKINKLLSGIENPANLLGGGSVTKVAELIRAQVKTPEQACALIKFYQNQKSLVGLSFGGDAEDFYEAIHDDLVTKMNTTGPSEELINAIDVTTSSSVNEQEEENYDDDFFYKVRPAQSYYYDKNDNVSDIEDDTDMDVEEWDEDDFDAFYEKYPYKKGQRTFPDTEHGRRWFKGYSQEHGGKFPVFKRKKSVNERVRSADAEFYSDNSHSSAENGLIYLKNGDKDEVSDLLSNLPSDTTYMALLDCERADFSDIDLKDFKRLAFINLKGTPNNLLKTNGHSFEDNGGSFYVPKKMKSVNEQREYRSDNSHSRAENGMVYLKNGDKDEVSDLLSNLPSDTTFMALLDCERADFSDIDLKDFKRLAFINLKGTPNNLLKTNGHSFIHDDGAFYVTKNL